MTASPFAKKLMSATGANLGMQLAAKVLLLLAALTLARALGPTQLGVYAYALSVATIATTLARFGLEPLLVRELASSYEQQDYGRMAALHQWARSFTLRTGVGMGLLLAATAWAVADAGDRVTLAAAGLLLAVNAVVFLPTVRLRSVHAPVLASVGPMLVFPAAWFGGTLLLGIAVPSTPENAVIMHTIAMALMGVMALALLRSRWPEAPPMTAKINTRQLFWAAVPLTMMAGLHTVNQQTDVLMLKHLTSDAETGLYSVVVQLARIALLPLAVINGVVAPQFASMLSNSSSTGVKRHAQLAAAGACVLTAPLALGLVVAGTPLLSLFGPEFAQGSPALAALALGGFLNAAAGSVGTLLVMGGHEREVGLCMAISVAANIIANIGLIPLWGSLGAATASTIAVALMNMLLIIRVRHHFAFDPTILGAIGAVLMPKR